MKELIASKINYYIFDLKLSSVFDTEFPFEFSFNINFD